MKSFDSQLRQFNMKLKKQERNPEIVLFSSQLRDLISSVSDGFLKEHWSLKSFGGTIKRVKKVVNKTITSCKKDYSEAQKKAAKLQKDSKKVNDKATVSYS